MDNNDKFVPFKVLEYTVNKIKTLKADVIHKHIATDITEDESHNFVTLSEKNKIDKLIDSGDGKHVLYNDGTYKDISGSVDDTNLNSTLTTLSSSKINSTYVAKDGAKTLTDNNYPAADKEKVNKLTIAGDGTKFLSDNGTYKATSNSIDDSLIGTSSTYSSSQIENKLKQKSDITHTHTEFTKLLANTHTHSNKNVLDDISLERFSKWNEKTDKIVTTGVGDKCLTDDGTYKIISTVSDWSTQVLNKPFETIDTTTLSVDSSNKKLSVKRVVLTFDEYDALSVSNKLDDNTIYIITDDKNDTNNTTTTNGVTQEQINRWDSSAHINDSKTSSDSTYSSDKIETRLTDVQNTIKTSQTSMAQMWQKTFLNKVANDKLLISTTDDFSVDKCVVQAYKFIEGSQNNVEVLKKFNNSDFNSFYYDGDNIEMNESMRIKDTFTLNKTLNSDGYYETDVIDKNLFFQLNEIGEI